MANQRDILTEQLDKSVGIKSREQILQGYDEIASATKLKKATTALGRPVQVDLLQSTINGADSCRFAVHIPEDEFD